MCGTAPYLSPEAQGANWCYASDIWSVGLTIWECWSGESPPSPQTSYIWDSIKETVDVEPHACDPDLKSIIESCLQYLPEKRPNCEQLRRLNVLQPRV